MTAPLIFYRTLIVCLATTLLIACDSSSSNNAAIPEINSFHIYTADQTIYSFNEDTKQSTKRGEFDAGEHQFIELNTDESKQGYDYAVYAFENGIYLLDYDKDNNGKITKLTQFAQNKTICSIIPKKTASRAGFSDGKASNRSTLDLPIVTIELKAEGQICDPLLNLRDKLDFSQIIDDDASKNSIIRTAGSSEAVLGGLVIDYRSGGVSASDPDADISNKGKIGFLGYDLIGSKIVFNYSVNAEKDQWSTYLASDPNIVPFSKQVSSNFVLVQGDEDLFVLNAQNLFTVNTASSTIPIQDKIDALFSNPHESMLDSSPVETNRSQNQETFLVKHDNNLFYFDSTNFTEIPFNQIQSETKIDFDLTTDNTALVVQENPDSSQTLVAISTLSGEATTILTAEKVELQVIGNEFFINTLELENAAGWQAHWFKSLNSPVTYENSRFIFAHDMRERVNTLLLLSSDDEKSEAAMIKPALYLFDKTQVNGRKKGFDKNENRVEFSFGTLNTNVSSIELSFINNDKFGKLILTGVNMDTGVGRAVREYYYFEPSETVSSQSIIDQSLRLMLRQTL